MNSNENSNIIPKELIKEVLDGYYILKTDIQHIFNTPIECIIIVDDIISNTYAVWKPTLIKAIIPESEYGIIGIKYCWRPNVTTIKVKSENVTIENQSKGKEEMKINYALYDKYKSLNLKPGHRWVLVKYKNDNIFHARILCKIKEDKFCCISDYQMDKYNETTDEELLTGWDNMKEFIQKEEKMAYICLPEETIREYAKVTIHDKDSFSKIIQDSCKEWTEKHPAPKKKIPWSLEEKVKWAIKNTNLVGIAYTTKSSKTCAPVNNLSLKDINEMVSFETYGNNDIISFEKEEIE